MFYTEKNTAEKDSKPKVMNIDDLRGLYIYQATIDDMPILIEGQPYIPLRSFSEIFEREVEWDEKPSTATLDVTTDDIAELLEIKVR
jgi:hypothetical protein